ncbi:MAG: helix-turn-helix domain-containing protein [Bacteroides sp.]|nr:helix-turn-helix domain-containing protein [Bacteroides sp.]
MTEDLKQYIEERFNRLETVTLIGTKEILTTEEALIYTGYSLKGLYKLTSTKQIPHYKRNNKLYFKRSELDRWMTERRVMTMQEIHSKATTYAATH